MLSKLLQPNRIKAALHAIKARRHRAGRKMGEDFMVSGWVSEMLLEAGRQMLRGKQG